MVFNYNEPTCAEQIRDYTKGKLHYAFDTISNEQTGAICAAALATEKSDSNVYSSLMRLEKLPRNDVKNQYTLAYTGLGEDFKIGEKDVPGSKNDYEYI